MLYGTACLPGQLASRGITNRPRMMATDGSRNVQNQQYQQLRLKKIVTHTNELLCVSAALKSDKILSRLTCRLIRECVMHICVIHINAIKHGNMLKATRVTYAIGKHTSINSTREIHTLS